MLLDAAAVIYATRRTRRPHRGSSSSRLSRIDDVTELLRISDATVTKRYDTMRCFNVRSQADVLLNLIYAAQDRQLTRSSAIAEGPRNASCQSKSCQLPRNGAETRPTCTTSPEQIEVMKLDG